MDGKAFLIYLLKNHYLTKEQIQTCLQESVRLKIPLAKILVQRNYIPSQSLKLALTEFNQSQQKTLLVESPKQKIEVDLNVAVSEDTSKQLLQELETLPFAKANEILRPSQQRFGKYELLEEIARGGMGVVYKAKHIELGQIYALKVILSGHFASQEDIARFYQEAKLMAKLKHPNIVQVVDSGEEQNQHYLAMELIEGSTLKQCIQEKIPVRQALLLFKKILEGLASAHEQGIIHRDLKPANIFITPSGEPKIGDFGLAKEVTSTQNSHRMTKSGEILGTPSYMSPEQSSGEGGEVDARSDIYAVGVCLYEALTQRCPFEGKTLHELFYKITSEDPRPPSSFHKKIHHDLDTIILKALEKRKSRRYQSAKIFAEDIENFLEGYPILAKPLSRREQFYKWLKRNKKFVFVALIAILCGIGGSIYWQHLRYQKRLKQHKERLEYWKVQLKDLKLEQRMRDYALLEIAKMSEEEICKELISVLEEGILYFLKGTNRSVREDEYYKTMADALGYIENPKSEKPLRIAMEKMSEKIIQNKSSSIAELQYLVSLSYALGNLKQKGTALFLEQIHIQFLKNNIPGQDNIFWAQILSLYKELSKLEDLKGTSLSSFQEYFQRGLKKAVQEDWDGAIADYNQALHLNPQSFEVYINRGDVKQGKGDLEGAMSDYNEAIKLNPQSPVAYDTRGVLKKTKGDLEGAMSDYNQAIKLNPRSNTYSNRGSIKEIKGDLEGAMSDYNQSIKLDPQNTYAYNNRGNIKNKKGDLDGALLDYNQAIKLNPRLIETYYNMGIIKTAKNDIEGALFAYNQAITFNPQYDNAYNNRGNIKYKKGDIEGALLDYNQTILLNPQHFHAYHSRGVVKYKKGDIEGALLDYNQALTIDPKFLKAYLDRANAKYSKEDWDGAIEDYSQTIILDPQHISAHCSRGMARLKKGGADETEKAKQDFQIFLKLVKDPNYPQLQEIRQFIFTQFPSLKSSDKK